MNDFNEECKRDITVFFEKLTQLRHRLPSEDAIYSMLETYAFPHDVIGNSVEEMLLFLIILQQHLVLKIFL